MSALSTSSASSASESSISLGRYPVSPCADGPSPPQPSTSDIKPAVTQTSGNSRQPFQRGRHMVPAGMVSLGQRRDSSTGGRPPRTSPAPQVDERPAYPESVRYKAAPIGVRARDHLVGILLRHSEGRALIFAPESLPGWNNWILNILHSLGVPITSYGSEWEEEERPQPQPQLQPSEPRDNYDDHLPSLAPSSSADQVVIRERYPRVRRTHSAPGPYSDRYPAANSFRVLKHQFSPRTQRRRFGSNSTTDSSESNRSLGSAGSSNPPVVFGTNPTQWPVVRNEPFLRIGGRVSWDIEGLPFGCFVGVANTEMTLQYLPWGAQQRMMLWYHILQMREQLVDEQGEWFQYSRGYFTAGTTEISFQYQGVWQEGPLKPPKGVPVHHCVQLRRPELEAEIFDVLTEEPEEIEEASEAHEGHPGHQNLSTLLGTNNVASSSAPELGRTQDLTQKNLSRASRHREVPQWIHHYMWDQNGVWFSCASLEELDVWGHTCVTEWIEGWQPDSLKYS